MSFALWSDFRRSNYERIGYCNVLCTVLYADDLCDHAAADDFDDPEGFFTIPFRHEVPEDVPASVEGVDACDGP